MTDFKTGPEREKKNTFSAQCLKKIEFTPRCDIVVLYPVSEFKRMSLLHVYVGKSHLTLLIFESHLHCVNLVLPCDIKRKISFSVISLDFHTLY